MGEGVCVCEGVERVVWLKVWVSACDIDTKRVKVSTFLYPYLLILSFIVRMITSAKNWLLNFNLKVMYTSFEQTVNTRSLGKSSFSSFFFHPAACPFSASHGRYYSPVKKNAFLMIICCIGTFLLLGTG